MSGVTRMWSTASYICWSNRPTNGSVVSGAADTGCRPTANRTKPSEPSSASAYQKARRWSFSIGGCYPAHGGAPAPQRVSPVASCTSATIVARGSSESASTASIASVDEAPLAKRNV